MTPPTRKLQVSTLQLRKKLEELASPAPRRRARSKPQPPQKSENLSKPVSQPKSQVVRRVATRTLKGISAWLLSSFPSLLLITEITGLVVVLYLAVLNLVSPAINGGLASGCQGKVNGQWQTRWGLLTLNEDNQGAVKGKLAYKHLDKGVVKVELTGRLDGQELHFDWQEMQANKKSVVRGSGLFVFSADCLEFFGSTPNLGGWQGRRISP